MTTLHYEEGEEVLAQHGPCIYPAKIVKIAPADDDPKELQFRVHYLKWNKSWDEWVRADRLLKKTDENLKKMDEVKKQVEDVLRSGKSKKSSSKKRRISTEPGIDKPDVKKDEIAQLSMPASLKTALIADWEAICKNQQLIDVPVTPNIDTIIDDYISQKKRDPEEQKEVVDVMNGLRVYFERSLATRLLYDYERPQFNRVSAEHGTVPLSSLYGVQHLLRLFVLLPTLMVHSDMDVEHTQKLIGKITPLLKYISKNLSSMDSKKYVPMSSEYLEELRGDDNADAEEKES